MRGWWWPFIYPHLFNCAVEREAHCKQIPLACVGSACSGWATLGWPQPKAACTSQVHTAQAPGCTAGKLSNTGPGLHALPRSKPSRLSLLVLHKGTDLVGPEFCALPGFEQLRWLGAWWAHSPSWVVCLITSLVPGPQFPGCTVKAPSQMCYVSPLESWSLTVTLLVDVNHPGSWEGFVSNWEPAYSLVEDGVSWAEIVPCLLLCLGQGEGLVQSPLVFTQSFVLWVG